MQMVMDLGRSAREKRGISLKTPVKGITVVCKDEGTLSALGKLQGYVKGELNAWEVRGMTVSLGQMREKSFFVLKRNTEMWGHPTTLVSTRAVSYHESFFYIWSWSSCWLGYV